MKPHATNPRKSSFVKVLDGRKQPIRGLWKRGENFYAQLQVDGKTTWPKLSANTTAQAVEELNKLKVKRREGTLNVIRHAPKLSEAIEDYKQSAEFLGKRPSSQSNERGYFKLWVQRLGHVRVDKIQAPAIVAVRDEVHKGGRNPRTCNLYVGALMQVLKYCRDRGKVARLRFLALTGAREQEASRVKWQDVDIARRQVTIGADGLSKNHEARDVDMTPELVELLTEMEQNRAPDSAYLFPSPQRGKKDKPISNMRNALEDIRTEADLKHVAFHHMRDLFISKCVMAGVPFMTIASWVGHKDGGVLIGKVYGHLSKDHKADMASKLSLFKTPENVVDLQQQAAG